MDISKPVDQGRDPDFGATPDQTYMVEDAHGTRSVAHYHDGIWWEGHSPEDYEGRPQDAPCRVQLDHVPVRIVPDGEVIASVDYDDEDVLPLNAGTLFENNVSITGMWPIPQPHIPREFTDVFGLFEPLPEGLNKIIIDELGWDASEIDALIDGEPSAWEALCEQMLGAGKQGWIVVASTPVYQRTGKLAAMNYSWGYTQSEMFFAEDVGSGLRAAVAWATKLYDEASASDGEDTRSVAEVVEHG